MEAQVILDGVRGEEDGTTGSDDQDKPVESLEEETQELVSRAAVKRRARVFLQVFFIVT